MEQMVAEKIPLSEQENSWERAERRRTIRIKRSALLKAKLDDIDRPAIKIAENRDEFSQAFGLVYKEYLSSGYISEPKTTEILYNIYHLLPETAVFVAKSYLTVVSTLTQIFDSDLFGLPMDSLYRKELDSLRDTNRKIVEITALATQKSFRWKNIFMFLCKAMLWHAKYYGVNDLCITVNPKHVRFYKTIFLFEQFGPEKHYPSVNAPAVPLRLNMDDIDKKGRDEYDTADFESNLYDYFFRMQSDGQPDRSPAVNKNMSLLPSNKKLMDKETAEYFIGTDRSIINGLSPVCKTYLESIYPGLKM